MKNIQIILFILFSSLAGIAQNPIVDFEYYVDEDPGYNLATPIPIAPGLLHELDFTIPTSGLSKGFHVAGMRGRDDRNNWSLDFIQFFYVDLLQHEDDPITQVEYFIDNDPGIGNATPVSITPGKVVDLAFNLDVNMLEPGFHFLSVRSASENNIWSHAYTHMFLMDVLDGGESPITRVEYFMDEDPGIGNATPVSITPGKVVDLAFEVDVNNLEEGFHFLSIRSASENNIWSHAYTRMFLMDLLDGGESPITRVEYFMDEDPGIGNATPVSITPGKVVDLAFEVDVNNLEEGFHFLSIRSASENNIWSHAYTRVFLMDLLDGGESPITRVEYFIDEDPGIGNANPVAITPGKVVDLSFEVDLTEQESGFHFITVRSQSEAGTWSTGFYQMFYINKISSFSNPNLTAIEYFLDEDPGFGNGSMVAINPPEPVADQDFVVALGQVEPGEHILYLRAIDEFDNWSIVAFDTVLVEIGSAFALRFDGDEDYLEAGDFQFPAADLTIEAWINPTVMEGTQEILYAFNENDAVQFRLHPDGSVLYGESTSESWDYVISEPAAVLSGRWTHVAVTKSGGHCNLYINGIHAGYYQFDNNPITTTLNIGGRSTNLDRFFDGEMDEVRIWDIARSQQEIRNNLCASLTGTEAGIYALWHFDEGPGSPTATDSGPNGFGAWFYNMEPNAGSDCSWIDHNCELPPAIDLAIQSITTPDDLVWNEQSENIPVSILIKNYGMDDFDGLLWISYILDANSPITENPSLSIPAGEYMVFDFTSLIDLSSVGFHNLEVNISLSGDEYPDNDILEKVIETVTLNRKVYAYNTWPNQSGLPQGPVVFDLENPEYVFSLADQSSENIMQGGTWMNGLWYGIASDTLYTIDTITGNRTLVGVPGSFISSLAYDASSNKLFGLSWVSLEEIDPLTGNSTYLGYSGTEGFTAMACNAAGQLYALNVEDDQLYQINKESGEATAIGSIGFDANYEQDMDFDPLTGNIFMTTFNQDAGQGELRAVDPSTGNTSYLGTFRGGMELSGFAIPLEIAVLDAEFSAAPLSGTTPLEVQFSDLSSGNPVSWMWDFGDGGISEVQNPTHIYQNAGSYSVSLTVSDGIVSNEISMENLIQVNEPGQGNWLAEYFYDEDPGYGKATPIYGNGDEDVLISINAPIGNLADGLHTFYSRSKYENGSWSQTMSRPFLKEHLPEDANPNIVYLEYFFDSDPGFGEATAIAVDASSPMDIAVNLPLETLDFGLHTLYVRAQDGTGKWSIVMQRSFVMGNYPADPLKELVKAEYFIDEDPGQGNAELVIFDPNNGIHQQEFEANLEGLEWGGHTLYMRTMDESGGWSITVAETFNVEEPPIIADFSADITAGSVPLMVQFTDETFVSEPTEWSWDFGDGNTSTAQNPQHIFNEPGTYTVSLSATNDEGSDTEIKENYITVYPPVYALEYFFDVDPGYGNASEVYSYSADLGGFNFLVPLDELTDGYHLLFVRIQDTAKVWTQTFTRAFIKTRLANDLNPNISIMEYFVDTDPGFGHGISLPVSQSAVPVVEALIPLDECADGLHNIFVRSQDENGRWSETFIRPFLKSYLPGDVADVLGLEYFVDNDPGVGNGTAVSIPNPGAAIERSFVVNLSAQTPGEHRLFVRAIDSRGNWSIVYNQLIEVTATGAVQIVQLPEGWSGISSYIIPDDAAVANIFAPVQDELVILQNFDGMYWPMAGVNTLGNWDDQAGYQIKMETMQQVTFTGEIQQNLTASISEGWNYLPVLNACENDVEEFFGQIANELQIVKEVAGSGVYWPQFGVNTLGDIVPGKAYFVLVDEDVEVAFPACTPSDTKRTPSNSLADKTPSNSPAGRSFKTPSNSPLRGRTDPASEKRNDKNDQSDNSDIRSSVAALCVATLSPPGEGWGEVIKTPLTHTIAIPLQVISSLNEESIITIYNQLGLCCGVALFENQNLVLTAFGDDPTTPQIDGMTEGEAMNLRVFNPETGNESVLEVEFEEQMPQGGYFVNHGLSALKDLQITGLDENPNSKFQVSIYPNPSKDIFNIRFGSQSGISNWEVTDIHGSIIALGNDPINDFTIDISSHPKGIYYLKITHGGLQTVKKLVLQ